MQHRFFPFTAIVEQERLRRALLLNAVNPAVGGVLIRGPSGTGKSTAVRGLAELLPEIDVVAECEWSCDPKDPCARCVARGGFEVTRRPRRIVNLPLNATEDRVAGTVDIARALKEGERALEPGLLAEANRGILYVNEINLLDDHLTDILLDAAALGVNVVEREGVSISHPARFLLVGTMNPEEGELRPQIADRIGLQVEVDPLENPEARAEVARRREAFTHNPQRFIAEWEPVQESLREDVARAERLLPEVRVPDLVYGVVAKLVLRAGVASHRADVTMIECAKALAALAGRTEVETEDVLGAGELALGHRLPFDPFGPAPTLDRRDVRRLLDEILDVEVAPKKAPSQTA